VPSLSFAFQLGLLLLTAASAYVPDIDQQEQQLVRDQGAAMASPRILLAAEQTY
jgi:hypothetical protein